VNKSGGRNRIGGLKSTERKVAILGKAKCSFYDDFKDRCGKFCVLLPARLISILSFIMQEFRWLSLKKSGDNLILIKL